MGWQRSAEVTYEVVGDQAMLVDPAGKELFTLNAVGTLIWETLDGTLDAAGITGRLLGEFTDVTRAELERDVTVFLDELGSIGLVVNVEAG